MNPRLRYARGLWWCGPLTERGDYFLWACCAPTVEAVWELWQRVSAVEHHPV